MFFFLIYFVFAFAIFAGPSIVVYFILRKRIRKLEAKISGTFAAPQDSRTEEKGDSTVESPDIELLRGRIARLEASAIGVSESPQVSPRQGGTDSVVQPVSLESVAQKESTIAAHMEKPLEKSDDGPNRFIEWIKEDWLLKLGAFLLLVGVGWFVSLAFANDWIGPMGRIALGISGGIIVLLIGEWRIRKYIQQGSVFLVVGSTAILLTIFAARFVYDFFSPFTALIVMFLTVAYVALASIRYNRRALALASLILAGITPILTGSPDPSAAGLFSYLLVITVGTLWVVAVSGWRVLTPAALVLIFLYSLPYFSYISSGDKDIGLLFSFIFTAIFFVFNTLAIIKSNDKEFSKEHLYTAAFIGIFLLSWVLTAAAPEWQSLLLVFWMLVFSAGAYFIFAITRRMEPFYIYSAVTIGLIAAATAIELNGPALTIAYTIESASLIALSFYILRSIERAERLSSLLIVSVALSTTSIISAKWYSGVLHSDFSVLAILTIVLFSLGWWFNSLRTRSDMVGEAKIAHLLMMVGALYGLVLLWKIPHSLLLLNPDLATMISLILYTLIGLSVHFKGKFEENKQLVVAGGLLLGFVVGRLILIDVWQMDLAGRVTTFILIGTLLMGTAFIGRKKKTDTEVINENV